MYGILEDDALTALFGVQRVTLRELLGAERVLLLETRPSFDLQACLLVILVHDTGNSYRMALTPAQLSRRLKSWNPVGPVAVSADQAESAFAPYPCGLENHWYPTLDGISYEVRIEGPAGITTCHLSNPRAEDAYDPTLHVLLDLTHHLVQEHGDDASREAIAIWRRYEGARIATDAGGRATNTPEQENARTYRLASSHRAAVEARPTPAVENATTDAGKSG